MHAFWKEKTKQNKKKKKKKKNDCKMYVLLFRYYYHNIIKILNVLNVDVFFSPAEN